MATTVRVDESVAARLRNIATKENRPIGNVINDALEQYETECFWRETRDAYNRLRADKDAWADYQDEIRMLEGGSMDGLQDEDQYYSLEEVEQILADQT